MIVEKDGEDQLVGACKKGIVKERNTLKTIKRIKANRIDQIV